MTDVRGLSRIATFLPTGSLRRLLFRLAPTGIGVVFVHGFAECFGLLAEVLLVDNAILVHDECHHTGGAVFGGISYEREACYSQELLLYFSWSSRSACNHSSK